MYSLQTASSAGLTRLLRLKGGLWPGSSRMVCPMPLSGGRPGGRPSLNTVVNLLRRWVMSDSVTSGGSVATGAGVIGLSVAAEVVAAAIMGLQCIEDSLGNVWYSFGGRV